MAEPYSEIERNYYQKHLPEGVRLDYSHAAKTYELKIRPQGSRLSVLLRRIKRETVINWTRPTQVLNYVARRALAEKGYPATFRAKSGSVITLPR